MNIEVFNTSNLPTCDFEEFQELQGYFKLEVPEKTTKLKNIIIERGFKYPFVCWVNKKGEIGPRPKIELEVWKVDYSYWPMFKPHYYLDLPIPPAAEAFIGVVNGEPVSHVMVAPFFTANGYRATRLVVMPEWQGAGVGTRFLNYVAQYHLEGKGRCGKKFGTFFHTSHPQLCAYLRRANPWIQKSAQLYGGNKAKSRKSIRKANPAGSKGLMGGEKGAHAAQTGYGGHFRAVQGFKYIGVK